MMLMTIRMSRRMMTYLLPFSLSFPPPPTPPTIIIHDMTNLSRMETMEEMHDDDDGEYDDLSDDDFYGVGR